MGTLKEALNRANPTTVADLLRKFGLGNIIRAQAVQLFRVAASTPVPLDTIAAVQTCKLPDDAKCARLLRATAIAGAGTLGDLITDLTPMTTVATVAGHAGWNQAGDLTFASADAWTKLDILYVPIKQEVITVQLPVVAATGVMALPASLVRSGLYNLLSATLDAGTIGQGVVIAPGVVPATTLQCNLDFAKTQVQFRIADNVTLATVKLGLVPDIDVNTLLPADSGGLY